MPNIPLPPPIQAPKSTPSRKVADVADAEKAPRVVENVNENQKENQPKNAKNVENHVKENQQRNVVDAVNLYFRILQY